jgi:hypothetical protein
MEDFEVLGISSKGEWEYENSFYWFSHQTRLAKLLAHFEIYKKIIDLPGDVLEFGVFKGTSLIRLATFRNLLENDFSRKIIGFDAFGKFPVQGLTLNSDKVFVKGFEEIGGEGLSVDVMQKLIERKGFRNVELYAGNVFETLPAFLVDNPALRISILHLDLDVMEPTEFVLDLLYSRLVPQGIVIFDDYSTVEGESIAVDSFIWKHKVNLRKLPYYNIPTYFVKE